jgi:dihydropteroate synthase
MTVEAFDLWRSRQSGALVEELGELLTNISNIRQSQLAGLDRAPSIVGILNLTPDSFSDGGDYSQVDSAIKRARTMFESGASLIDIGGESTRPGATPISSLVEQNRVLPVAEALLAEGIPVSVDTYHPDTMEAACALGVNVINDVSGFTAYPNSMKVGAASGKTLVLAHSVPLNIEEVAEFDGEVAVEIYESFLERIKIMEELGVSKRKIIIDPGLGFKKSQEENFNTMRWLSILHGLGCSIMIGASRKFGRLKKGQSPKDRMAGSVAASLSAAQQGAQLLRVHDVAETQQALGVWRAMG